MLIVRNIQHSFDGLKVLRGIDLEIKSGEVICLLGPSGCGKTTLLRIIAGLEQPEKGDIFIDGNSIIDIPVHQRGFGLMFQDFALFPHMDVGENIAFGLKMQRISSADRNRRVVELLDLVNLRGFEKRDISHLSGGERQRVALARSLAPSPSLLMLDEPLGSLDATLRNDLILELRHTISNLGLTVIYVTHDQHEAFALADRVVIMNDGQVEQFDTPQIIYQRPATTFAARFLGLDNVLPVMGYDGMKVETSLGSFQSPQLPRAILIHPNSLNLLLNEIPGTIEFTVEDIVFDGDSYRLRLKHHSGTLLTVKVQANIGGKVSRGNIVYVRIDPEAVIPLLS